MERFKINRKFALLVIVVVVLFLAFLWLLFSTNTGPKSKLTPTPASPSRVPNNNTEKFKGSFNENDPKLWIGEDGKRIKGDY